MTNKPSSLSLLQMLNNSLKLFFFPKCLLQSYFKHLKQNDFLCSSLNTIPYANTAVSQTFSCLCGQNFLLLNLMESLDISFLSRLFR